MEALLCAHLSAICALNAACSSSDHGFPSRWRLASSTCINQALQLLSCWQPDTTPCVLYKRSKKSVISYVCYFLMYNMYDSVHAGKEFQADVFLLGGAGL